MADIARLVGNDMIAGFAGRGTAVMAAGAAAGDHIVVVERSRRPRHGTVTTVAACGGGDVPSGFRTGCAAVVAALTAAR